jgi:hypothetical protein
MAVLVEAISVVIRVDALKHAFPGGWESFKEIVPNRTLCCDNEVARIGFMAPADAQSFVAELESHGLCHQLDGEAKDIVVMDQLRGPATHCTWIEFGHIPFGPDNRQRIAVCRQDRSESNAVMLPDGWTFEGSMSQKCDFRPLSNLTDDLTFVRREGNIDVYIDRCNGKEVYVGRTDV